MYFTASHPSLGCLFILSRTSQPLQTVHNWYLPLIKIRGGLLYRTKKKKEKEKEERKRKKKRQKMDPKILQVCVPYQTGFTQFIPLLCNGLVPVHQGQTSWQPAFFWVLYCSLPSLGTRHTRPVLLSSHRGLSQAHLRGRKGSSSPVLTTARSICPPVNRSCSALRDTNFTGMYLSDCLSKAEGN